MLKALKSFIAFVSRFSRVTKEMGPFRLVHGTTQGVGVKKVYQLEEEFKKSLHVVFTTEVFSDIYLFKFKNVLIYQGAK